MEDKDTASFWEHLDVLRGCLIRMLAVAALASVGAFVMKDIMFDIILAPCQGDFVTYRWMGAGDFNLHLINTGLAEQMMIHMKMSVCFGLLAASPYILYILYGFVCPALYEEERKYSIRVTLAAYVAFLVGVLVDYLLTFPLTVRFLGLYQVSEDIDNMLTISSYVDTLLMMSIAFGIIFEIPVLSWILAKYGLLNSNWMSHYRRHAIVAILIVTAIITPTTDPFTMFIVAIPIWGLYELSILLVRKTQRD